VHEAHGERGDVIDVLVLREPVRAHTLAQEGGGGEQGVLVEPPLGGQCLREELGRVVTL